MAHSPAFQFYPADFTGDKNTIRMSALDVGVYWLLICECWEQDNSLPNDLDELAYIARLDRKAFEKVWNGSVKRCFLFDEKKNCFHHKRIAEEIRKQKSWSRKKSESGKKGAEKRWKEKPSDDSTAMAPHGTAMAPPCDTIAPDSSCLVLSCLDLSCSNPSHRAADIEIGKKPPSLPTSAEKEITCLLDAIAPLVGAKSRETMANKKGWREFAEVAVKEQHPVTDILGVVKSEANRNKAAPQFFTPQNCLKILQAKKVKASNGFHH